MAKIKHTSAYDVVDHVVTTAKKKKIMHLSSQEEEFNGEFLKINNEELINFGTCGYLGLEKHPDILAKSHELLDRYGSHFSISRAFVKAPYLEELENLISKIFDNHPVVIYTSTSVAHQSMIGTIIQPNDLIILDQQVHYSVQYPCQFAKLQGTMVKMIRHNSMEMLEDFIKRGYNQYDKIWYMADGVYSMYGDLPHKKELLYLLEKYPKFHLYFDDAHGVGWTGINGCGSLFEYFKHSEKVVLISTLAKGFGSIGGIAVFNDLEMHRKVDIYGGVLSYTHPLSPSNVGAAIGSAELLLSDTIHTYQNELKELMEYLNTKLDELNLTNTSSNETPIYFIGAGSAKVTHNLIQRVLADGLYVNTATYPVVPNDKTGLRFTLTRHNTKAHIDQLVHSVGKNFHLAVDEENEDLEKIYKTFNVPFKGKKTVKPVDSGNVFVETYNSINEIDSQLWDGLFKDNGNYSHNGLRCIEEIFSNNERVEENWGFHYLIIKDENNEIILATFFTSALYKDDMLALENISRKIEKQREEEPYYLCSKTLAMGSLFTEGEHLYVNEGHSLVNQALNQFFIEAENLKKATGSTVVILRDFQSDFKYHENFENEGFVKISMPNSLQLKNVTWKTPEEMLASIPSSKKRKGIRYYALRNESLFDITIKSTLTEEESKRCYELFSNVKFRNFGLNFFEYPSKIPTVLSRFEEYEFILIRLKGQEEIIASAWIYQGSLHSSPMIVGLDDNYIKTHRIYQQTVYQIIKRGRQLDKETIFCGFSADFEKQKYRAIAIPTFAYLKIQDTFNSEIINAYSNM
ncbi:aminotransferase class I/II-fold pyridoxal phosphate-dependent enzyme [Flavobacterium gawalongense]|uniref:Aminotransferase class I/II-fold pyridoxal phosphate-dependent enzyme n=1 Tax=Flavobacterium gawalongense TaxID=2594432 RepID=A0ABY3CMQ0_9FLAO|nr:aminotransferase class I/II-fold pyridoxal phosphate-dependent enzyme [Flavobacterium gawalongense]TRX02385.1 aminotransferase class I/II-fold pyridoxal phosphate-dependent enzyme [Flavobacterium gawalongense]TRX07786.1 aminotransferase class I/II-fold pyridoxal phosphate-dependent enzyme [Flavobacterium gawalongense]